MSKQLLILKLQEEYGDKFVYQGKHSYFEHNEITLSINRVDWNLVFTPLRTRREFGLVIRMVRTRTSYQMSSQNWKMS